MLSQLQEVLRAIEQGKTLESVDGVIFRNLIRGNQQQQQQRKQQLQQPKECNLLVQLEHQVDGKEAYRTLVALRKQKKQQQEQKQRKQNANEEENQQSTNGAGSDGLGSTQEVATGGAKSDGSSTSSAEDVILQRKLLAEKEFLKNQLEQHIQNYQKRMVQQNAQVTSSVTNQFARQLRHQTRSIQQRQQQVLIQKIAMQQTQLQRMQHLLTQSRNQLDQEMDHTKALLPLEFLFARNLKEFCQHQTIQRLQRLIFNFQTRLFGECWSRWLRFVEYQRQVERQEAVKTIIRVFHGHQARKHCRALRQTRQQLMQQEKQLRLFKTRYRHAQALRIQMAWRRFKLFKVRQHKLLVVRTVLHVQKQYRYKKSKRKAWAEFVVNVKRVAAAVAIQKRFRGLSARKRYRNLQQQKQKDEHLKRILNFQAGFQQEFEKFGAVALLKQKLFQPWLVRKQRQEARIEAHRQQALVVLTRALRRFAMKNRQRKWFQAIQRAKVSPTVRYRRRQESRFAHKHGTSNPKRHKGSEEFANDEERQAFRLQEAAICIQKHLRRWHQQRKYWLVLMRQKRLARKKRLELKNQKLQTADHQSIASKFKTLVAPSHPTTVQPLTHKTHDKKHLTATPSSRHVTRIAALLLNNKSKPQLAAMKIQNAYVRFCQVRRARYQQYREQACQVELHIAALHTSATHIQRRFRGMQARRFVKQKRLERFLRCLIRRWLIHTRLTRRKAANCIQRAFRAFQSRNLCRFLRKQKQKEAEAIVVIQRWFRQRVFIKTIWRRQLTTLRLRDEEAIFCQQSLVICKQHAMDQVALTSLESDLEQQLRTYIAHQHVLHQQLAKQQPQQAQTTPNAALSSVFAASCVCFPVFQLLFLEISGLSPLTEKKWDMKTILMVKLERFKVVTMFKAINKYVNSKNDPRHASSNSQQHHRRATTTEMFSSSDVDLAIAKAAGSTKKPLSYEEFGSALRNAAASKLPECTLWWSRFQGNDAQVLTLLWRFILQVETLKAFGEQLASHLQQYMHFQACRIQRAFRLHFAWKNSLFFRAKLRVQAKQSKEHWATIKIQTQWRRQLAKQKVSRQMQQVYLKFFDLTVNAPYWLNPRTGFSTWQKPPWLGIHDVLTPVVPVADLLNEFVVPCDSLECQQNTENRITAKVYCHDCDEYFCQQCHETIHLTKSSSINASAHVIQTIVYCGLCQFQIATRQCLDCTRHRSSGPTPASDGSDSSSVAAHKRPLSDEMHDYYCDCCFGFMHQRGNLVAHTIDPLVQLCSKCQNQRAVRQRCTSHDQKVCNVCAAYYHPPETCSSVVPIRFESLSIQKHKQKLEDERLERERHDKALIALRLLNAKKEVCATKIQKFYRRAFQRIHAQRQLQSLAKDSLEHWQQVQKDTKRSRQMGFLVKDLFGKADDLKTDSETMKVLRPMHWMARRRLQQRARFYGLLLDEYLHEGIPLPGLVTLYKGSNSIETTEDLRGWVKNRQLVRIDDQFLYVDAKVKLTDMSIPLAKAFDKENRVNAPLFLIEFSADHEVLLDTSSTFMRFLRRSMTIRTRSKARKAALEAEAEALAAATEAAKETLTATTEPTTTTYTAWSAANQYNYYNDPSVTAADAAANAQYWNNYWSQPQDQTGYDYGYGNQQLVSSQQYYYGTQDPSSAYDQQTNYESYYYGNGTSMDTTGYDGSNGPDQQQWPAAVAETNQQWSASATYYQQDPALQQQQYATDGYYQDPTASYEGYQQQTWEGATTTDYQGYDWSQSVDPRQAFQQQADPNTYAYGWTSDGDTSATAAIQQDLQQVYDQNAYDASQYGEYTTTQNENAQFDTQSVPYDTSVQSATDWTGNVDNGSYDQPASTWNAVDTGYGTEYADAAATQQVAVTPSDWQEAYDPSSGQMYFHNATTGETSWERPM